MKIIEIMGATNRVFYATPGSAAFDLRSKGNYTIPPSALWERLNWLEYKLANPDASFFQPLASVTVGETDSVCRNIVVIPTGVFIESAGKKEHALVIPRSGLAIKHGISVANSPGLIDSDYRQEIGVILINHGSQPFIVKYGDRLAQMIVMKHEVIKDVPVLHKKRSGGFGSTGK